MHRLSPAISLLLAIGLIGPSPSAMGQDRTSPAGGQSLIRGDQRVVIAMIDGFGTDSLEAGEMPALKGLMARGFSKTVRGVMPSVTNVNNASIACGAWPEEHGITGNSFFDEVGGALDYMESASYVRVPTGFQRAARRGIKSALLTAKKKTLALLSPGAAIAIAAKERTPEVVGR